jgi:hypothetical protein
MANPVDWQTPPDANSREFFKSTLGQHARVREVVEEAPQRYLLKRRGMDSVRLFLTNVYTLGIADYLAISQAHQDIDAIVTLSGYNTYTPEAKAQALQNGTGLFKFKELMGALHKEDEDEFAAYEPPKKN